MHFLFCVPLSLPGNNFSSWYSYKTAPEPNTQESMDNRKKKSSKSQWNRRVTVRLHILEMSETLHPWSLIYTAAQMRPEQLLVFFKKNI